MHLSDVRTWSNIHAFHSFQLLFTRRHEHCLQDFLNWENFKIVLLFLEVHSKSMAAWQQSRWTQDIGIVLIDDFWFVMALWMSPLAVTMDLIGWHRIFRVMGWWTGNYWLFEWNRWSMLLDTSIDGRSRHIWRSGCSAMDNGLCRAIRSNGPSGYLCCRAALRCLVKE